MMNLTLLKSGLYFLLLLASIGFSDSVCPPGLQQSCVCDEQPNGFQVGCQYPREDFTVLLHHLEKIRITKFRVVGAQWNVVKRFPNMSIQGLQLIDCGIREIENFAFEPISELLEELIIVNNSLQIVPPLGYLPKLLSLNLKNNKINRIDENAFSKTKNLKHLRLGGNKLGSLPRNLLGEIKDVLELLDLSRNRLTRMPAVNLYDLVNLMYLDLSENWIVRIADFELENLPALKEVRLNDNQLTRVTTTAFRDVPKLTHMFLQNNFLKNFDVTSMVASFRHLELIDISNNQLLEVPLLKELPNIRQILLNFNKIKQIDRYTFSGNPKLEVISLQSNEISNFSSNGFSPLFALTHLLLGNNRIRDIEQDVFNGMANLEQLSLKNNSITELKNDTFDGIRLLKMLDLSHNGIYKVSSGTFTSFKRLYWLDLSHNMIAKLPPKTFVLPIPNIILFGNPIHCNESVVWLVEYLVFKRVRTHHPFQSDVMCATPEKYSTVKLKDFIVQRTNETMTAMSKMLRETAARSSVNNIFGDLFPVGMRGLIPGIGRAEATAYSNVPVVDDIAKTLPGLRHISGLNIVPQPAGAEAEKFTSPFIRVGTGELKSLAMNDHMVKAPSQLAGETVDAENLDLSMLPPEVRFHVLRGGQLAGVQKEALENSLRGYTSKMYEVAVAARNGHPVADESRYLFSLKNLPKEEINEMLKGKLLPFLNSEQVFVIRDYYITKAVVAISRGDANEVLPEGMITPQIRTMIKALPPGYDISKIPTEVFRTIAEGRIPNINSLPNDLQKHILRTDDSNFPGSSKMQNVSSTENSLFNVSESSVDLIHAEQEAKRKARLRLYSTVMACAVAVVVCVMVIFFFVFMKRRKAALLNKQLECSDLNPDTIWEEQGRLPSSSRNRGRPRVSHPNLASGLFQNSSNQCSVISPIR